MASLVDLESKFLECHICLETYRKPKTIPCLHSFCEQCLNDYIASCREVQEGGLFPCPVCKQVVDVPDPSLPRDQWAGSFKGSFFLNELADCIKNASKTNSPSEPSAHVVTGESTCTKCGRGDADSFCLDCDIRICHNCARAHTISSRGYGHRVIDWDKYNSQRKRHKNCKQHAGRALDLYCPNCKVAICELCHLNTHKLCPGVGSLAQAAALQRTWLQELEARTNTYVDKLSRINAVLNRSLDKAEISKVRDVEHLKEFFIKTIHAMQQKQDDLLNSLRATYYTHCKALRDAKTDRDELLTALINARELTRSLGDLGSDWEVMKETDGDLERQVQSLIGRVENLPKPQNPLSSVTLDENATRGITRNMHELNLTVRMSSPIPTTPSSPMLDSPFVPPYPGPFLPRPTDTQNAVHDAEGPSEFFDSTVGPAFTQAPVRPRPHSVPSASMPPGRTPRLLKRIKTRTGLDTNRPDIWDLVVMPRGEIILVDHSNQCLKGMNMGPSASGSTVCRLALFMPLRVCRMSDRELAVSGQDKKLYIIRVSNNKLEATLVSDTVCEYWGLGSVNMPSESIRLAASCPSQASVHLIDIYGSVIYSITRDAAHNPLFRQPDFLLVTPDYELLVSDVGKRCIYRISLHGSVRFKYPCDGPFGIINPRGMAVDLSGHYLIVDKDGQQVVRLSSSGRYAGGILGTIHGLSFPEAVAVGFSGNVYVTSDTPSSDSQDILIFEVN